jgi:hypothetical protein
MMTEAKQLRALARGGDLRARILTVPEKELMVLHLMIRLRDRTHLGIDSPDAADLHAMLDRLDRTRTPDGRKKPRDFTARLSAVPVEGIDAVRLLAKVLSYGSHDVTAEQVPVIEELLEKLGW